MDIGQQDVGAEVAAPEGVATRLEAGVEAIAGLIGAGHVCSVSASFGKESTLCVVMLLEAVRRCYARGLPMRTHYVTSANTGIENPEMEAHLLACHDEVMEFAQRFGLPIEVRLAGPGLAAGFVVSTVGRGKLPRFPENSASRTCSIDWKVRPQQKLARELSDEAAARGARELVAIVGTRRDESEARARKMAERGESDAAPVRGAGGQLVLSPLADWRLDEVWDALALFLDEKTRPFPTFTDGASIDRLLRLYRDGNEGVCGIVLGDGGNRSPCGSRFGCWGCVCVGESDKSMESMLREQEYGYMRPLNDLRQLLMATRFDFSRRDLIGRTASEAGFVALWPDAYSLAFRRDLLKWLITMDVDEEARAEDVFEKIACGALPDTERNRRMASPQFQLVSAAQCVAIDFYWSLHQDAPHAFPAIDVWHEIRRLGRRYRVPTLPAATRQQVPEKRWTRVGSFDLEAPGEGLAAAGEDRWNAYRHPERALRARELDGVRLPWFEEESEFSIDAEKALELVELVYPEQFVEMRLHEAIEGARFLLNEGIVRLPRGMAGRYQGIAARGSYLRNVRLRHNASGEELLDVFRSVSIDDAAHRAEVEKTRAAEKALQPSLL